MKNLKKNSEQIEAKETPKLLGGLKTIELDSSGGFVCDINTGICGPIDEKKEVKK